MNRLAEAYELAAEALAALALELRAAEAQEPSGGLVAPSFEELAPEWQEQDEPTGALPFEDPPRHGSASVCPSHNIEYRKGRYGMYCPSLSDDPKWSNDKGYCTVTPKSAAAWMRQHA